MCSKCMDVFTATDNIAKMVFPKFGPIDIRTGTAWVHADFKVL